MFLAAAVILLSTSRVLGQVTSNTTCVTQYQPLENTKGQTPCLVASFLGATCLSDGDYDVPPLNSEGDNYDTPGEDGFTANLCTCNSVFYSLLSACAICQEGAAVTWTDWIADCPSNITYVGLYPNTIPSLTSIPGWAYLNVTEKNTFNVNEALADNSPDSTIGTNPSSTASNSISSTQLVTVTSSASAAASTSPAPQTASPSGSSSHKSAVVGGVVGALLGVSVLSVILYVYRRRLLSSRLGTGIRSKLHSRNDSTESTIGKTPLMSTNHSNTALTTNTVFRPPVYDPSDASTFPISPTAVSYTTRSISNTNMVPRTNVNASTISVPSKGTQVSYRGFAEV